LAERLRRERQASGLTLRALEAEIGVPFNCLSRVERGTGFASVVNAQRIEEWLAGRELKEGSGG
jgi:transcriptional regulator with XRE-family HTH domain